MSDIRRGEIFYVRRGGVTCGNEQHADRPAVVVSNNRNNEFGGTVEVVYMTTQPKTDLPTHVTVRSTGKISTVLCEQVHSVSTDRLTKYIGQCSESEMDNIDIALMISLQLDRNLKTSKKFDEIIEKQQDEIKGLREQLASAKEDAAKWQNEQRRRKNLSEPDIMTTSEGLIRMETERNTYKALYEQLVGRLVNGGEK